MRKTPNEREGCSPARSKHLRVDRATAEFSRRQVVRRAGDGEHYFVIRAYRAAVLLWPAVERAPGLFERDLSAKQLEWNTVLDLEDWQEVPTRVLSPLGCRLKDRCARAKPARRVPIPGGTVTFTFR